MTAHVGSTRSTVLIRSMLRSNEATRPTQVLAAHATGIEQLAAAPAPIGLPATAS